MAARALHEAVQRGELEDREIVLASLATLSMKASMPALSGVRFSAPPRMKSPAETV